MKKALLEENLLCTPLKRLFQKLLGTNGEKNLEKPQQFDKSDTISPNISIVHSCENVSKSTKYPKSTLQENRKKYNTEDEQGDVKEKLGLKNLMIEEGNTSYHTKESEVANKTYEKREDFVKNRNEKDAIIYNSVTNAEGPESIGYFIYIPIPANVNNPFPQTNSPNQKTKDDLTAEMRRPSKQNNIPKHRLRDSKASWASSLENNIKPITSMLEPESKPKLKIVSSEPSPEHQYNSLDSLLESTYFRPTVLAPMSDKKEVSLDYTDDSFYRLKNIEINDMTNKPIKEVGNSEQSQPSSLVSFHFQEPNISDKLTMIPQSKKQNDLHSDLESGKSTMDFSDQENNTKQSNITTNTDMKEEESKPSVSAIDITLQPIEILSGQDKYSFEPERDTAVSTFKSREPIEESGNTNYINAIPDKMSSQALEPGLDTVSRLRSTESSSIEPIKTVLESEKEDKFNPNLKSLESSLHFSTKSKYIKLIATTPDHSENVEPLKSSFDLLKQHHEPKPKDIKIAKENKMPDDTDLNSSIITLDFFLEKDKSKEFINIKEPDQVKMPKHSMESPEYSYELPKDPINSKPIIMMPEYKENQVLEPQHKPLESQTDPLESTNIKTVKTTQESEKNEYVAPESTKCSSDSSLKPYEITPLPMIPKPHKNKEIEPGFYQSESKCYSSLGSIKIEPLNDKTVLEPDSELSESKLNVSQQSINSNSLNENDALKRETQLSESKFGSSLESIKSKLYKNTEWLEQSDVLETDLKKLESQLDESLASKTAKPTIKNNDVIQHDSGLSGSKIISPLEIVKSNPPQVKEDEEIDLEPRRSKLDSSLESFKSTLLEVKQGLGPELEQSISMLKTSIASIKSKSTNTLQSIKSLKSIKSILGWTNRSNEEKELDYDSKLDFSIQPMETKSHEGKEVPDSNLKLSGSEVDYSHSTLELIKAISSNKGSEVDLEYTRSKLDSSLEPTNSLMRQEVHFSENSRSDFSLLESIITDPNEENNEIKTEPERSESKKDISLQSIGTNALEGSKGSRVLKRLHSESKPSQAELNSSIRLIIKFTTPQDNEKVELDSEPAGSCVHPSGESIKANSLKEREVSMQSRLKLKCSQESVKSNPTAEKELDFHLESRGRKIDSLLESGINPLKEKDKQKSDSAPSKSKTVIPIETKSLKGYKQEYYSKQSGQNLDSSLESIRTITLLKQNEGLKFDSEATSSKLYSISLLKSVETNSSEKEELHSLETIKLKQHQEQEVHGRTSDQGLDLSTSLESIKTKQFVEEEKLKIDSEKAESKMASLESIKTNPIKERYMLTHDSKQSDSTLQFSRESIKMKEKEDMKPDFLQPSISKLDFSFESIGTEPSVQTESGFQPSRSKLQLLGESPTHTKDQTMRGQQRVQN